MLAFFNDWPLNDLASIINGISIFEVFNLNINLTVVIIWGGKHVFDLPLMSRCATFFFTRYSSAAKTWEW